MIIYSFHIQLDTDVVPLEKAMAYCRDTFDSNGLDPGELNTPEYGYLRSKGMVWGNVANYFWFMCPDNKPSAEAVAFMLKFPGASTRQHMSNSGEIIEERGKSLKSKKKSRKSLI